MAMYHWVTEAPASVRHEPPSCSLLQTAWPACPDPFSFHSKCSSQEELYHLVDFFFAASIFLGVCPFCFQVNWLGQAEGIAAWILNRFHTRKSSLCYNHHWLPPIPQYYLLFFFFFCGRFLGFFLLCFSFNNLTPCLLILRPLTNISIRDKLLTRYSWPVLAA